MNDEELIEMTNYEKFSKLLSICSGMAGEYINRCILENRIDPNNTYYFENLLAMAFDPTTNKCRLICSNTSPNATNESVKYNSLRFLPIDETLFNKSSMEFDKDHINNALLHLIHSLDSDQKLQLYDALRDIVEVDDSGGL